MKLSSIITNLAAFIRTVGSSAVPNAAEGLLGVDINDLNGRSLPLYDGQNTNAQQFGMPIVTVSKTTGSLLKGDVYGALSSASFQYLFNMYLDNTVLNTKVVNGASSGMSYSYNTTNGVLLNSTAVIANNTYCTIQSSRYFSLGLKSPLIVSFNAEFLTKPATTTFFEMGIAPQSMATAVASTNGVFWIANASGIKPCIVVNSTILASGTDITSLLSTDIIYKFDIIKDDYTFIFICSNASTGVVISKQIITSSNLSTRPIVTDSCLTYVRVGVTGGAATQYTAISITAWSVMALDEVSNASAGEYANLLGFSSDTTPTNNTSTTNYANNTLPTTIGMSNTGAPLGTAALDGTVRFAAPAGGGADYIVFGYQVPLPYILKTYMVTIAAKNIGAAVATSATQIDFYLRYNGSAISLASSGYLTKYIGTQTFPIGSAISAVAVEGRITLDLSLFPAITHSSQFHCIVARIVNGTATASQVIELNVSVTGTFE